MRALIYGEFWPGTLPWLCESEMSKLGVAVTRFDYRDYVVRFGGGGLFTRASARVFRPLSAAKINKQFIIATEEDYDLILICKGNALYPEIVAIAATQTRNLINWNPDSFLNGVVTSANVVKSMPSYDLILSSRPHLWDKYKELGAKRLEELNWYYVPAFHYDYGLPIEYDVSFVGSWTPEREYFFTGLDTRVNIFGWGWSQANGTLRAKHTVVAEHLSQEHMSRVYNSSRVNLNLLTNSNHDLINLRCFEVPASRGCMFVQETIQTKAYFDSESVVFFRDKSEIESLLVKSADQKLESIAGNGYLRVTQGQNTISDRVKKLLSYLN